MSTFAGEEVFFLNCKLWQEQIVLLSYNESQTSEREALQNHLKHCRDCQQFQERLSETQGALNQLKEINRPIDLGELHEAIRPKPHRRLNWNFWRPLSWGVAVGLILLIGFATLAWMGVEAKWKDNGLTLRFGPEETPEITKQELLQLLQVQHQTTQVEMANQLQTTLNAFSRQLQDHLDERQQQTTGEFVSIFQAMQSQRTEDLKFIRQSIQNLAGATEAELLETYRALEFIMTAYDDGPQPEREP